MTPAQKNILTKLKTYKKIIIQYEDDKSIMGFNNGPPVNKASIRCLLRDGYIRPSDFDIEGKPMTFEENVSFNIEGKKVKANEAFEVK